MNGIICINKPKEYTSFDVVARIRGMSKTKRVGHAGTLDPMATGVLPVFLGNATRVCDILPNDNKRYLASFKLGITTDTQDITGVIKTQTQSNIKKEQIELELNKFRGNISQIPPMYSAVKINGKRLYDIARKGVEVERAPRNISIFELNLVSFDEKNQTGVIDVLCSKGTYVRTLIFDIGQNLSVGGTLTELERTQAGNFLLEHCISIDEAQRLTSENKLNTVVLNTDSIFLDYEKIELNEAHTNKFKNGAKLNITELNIPESEKTFRVYSDDNEFLALAKIKDQLLYIYKMFYINPETVQKKT